MYEVCALNPGLAQNNIWNRTYSSVFRKSNRFPPNAGQNSYSYFQECWDTMQFANFSKNQNRKFFPNGFHCEKWKTNKCLDTKVAWWLLVFPESEMSSFEWSHSSSLRDKLWAKKSRHFCGWPRCVTGCCLSMMRF